MSCIGIKCNAVLHTHCCFWLLLTWFDDGICLFCRMRGAVYSWSWEGTDCDLCEYTNCCGTSYKIAIFVEIPSTHTPRQIWNQPALITKLKSWVNEWDSSWSASLFGRYVVLNFREISHLINPNCGSDFDVRECNLKKMSTCHNTSDACVWKLSWNFQIGRHFQNAALLDDCEKIIYLLSCGNGKNKNVKGSSEIIQAIHILVVWNCVLTSLLLGRPEKCSRFHCRIDFARGVINCSKTG